MRTHLPLLALAVYLAVLLVIERRSCSSLPSVSCRWCIVVATIAGIALIGIGVGQSLLDALLASSGTIGRLRPIGMSDNDR